MNQYEDGTCELIINEVFLENEGEYMAVATNIFGEDSTLATLSVEAYEYVPDSEMATVGDGDVIESDDDVKSIEDEVQDEGNKNFVLFVEQLKNKWH